MYSRVHSVNASGSKTSVILGFGITAILLFTLPAVESMKGKVIATGEGQVTIEDPERKLETFEVSADAKITRDGMAATLGDIRMGDIATLGLDKKKTVISLEAVSSESVPDHGISLQTASR